MRVAQESRELTFEEQKLVRRVVEAVRRRRPDVEVYQAERHVLAALEEYRDSRVREFLPILLERAVLRRITA